jgi:hypothetical protein
MLMKVWAGHCLCLNIACADGTFIGLKGMEKHHSQWVEPQCDGLSVLIGNVECVAQVHEECIAFPAQVVLDV